MMTRGWCAVVLLAGCVGGGCGGDDSGMGSDTLLIDLDDAGRRQLCEQLSEREARSVECGQGTTVEIRAGDAEACIADFDNLSDRCTASVGDADVCLQAIEEEPCVVFVGDGGPCEALSRCPLSM